MLKKLFRNNTKELQIKDEGLAVTKVQPDNIKISKIAIEKYIFLNLRLCISYFSSLKKNWVFKIINLLLTSVITKALNKKFLCLTLF